MQLYLLQLVQALKFEPYGDRPNANTALAAFLIRRATENPILANYLQWYLLVETEDDEWTEMYKKVNDRLMLEIVEVRWRDQMATSQEKKKKLTDGVRRPVVRSGTPAHARAATARRVPAPTGPAQGHWRHLPRAWHP